MPSAFVIIEPTMLRFHAPYMEWAKTRPTATYDLAISNVLACSIDDLPGAADALALTGRNDTGYAPLIDAIAARYGVTPAQVTTAQGASGANFLAYAALLEPGDDVLIETPGYDPLVGAARMLGADVVRYQRTFESGYALDPDRVEASMTSQTKLIVVSSPHNPTSALAAEDALRAVGRLAAARGIHVLVDEVYLDATDAGRRSAVTYGDEFIVTSSLTKSYGLAGLRCGWVLSSPAVAERLRRARDVVDGTGSIVAERLGVIAFAHLDQLIARTNSLLGVNRPLAIDFVRSRPELRFVEPTGGTVLFPRLEGAANTSRFAERLLTERGTAVVPGHFFQAPSHFRLGFSGRTEDLRSGLAQLGAALDAAAW